MALHRLGLTLGRTDGAIRTELSPPRRAGGRVHFKKSEEYRQERLPLSGLLTVLKAWVVRFEEGYLSVQRYFEPYPTVLLELTDSAAGKVQPCA